MSKLGAPGITEGLDGTFTQEKGEQKRNTFWYISTYEVIMGYIFSFNPSTLSFLCR